jgi:hypothetical protein
MKTFTTLLSCVLFGHWAIASEEEFAIWSSVEITSSIERAGKVTVTGRADDRRIVSLQIVAFGQTNVLSGGDLKKIGAFPLADIKITHEAGYEQLGGYSLHVRLRRIAYDSEKNLQDETAIITVTEKTGLQPVIIRKTR